VSGLINIENTLKIENFPLNYFPVCYPFNSIDTTVSGVGYNIAKILNTLGNKVNFLSIVGNDLLSKLVYLELQKDRLEERYILPIIQKTPSSIVIYDKDGKRQIHCDLKDIQDTDYPLESYKDAIKECDIAILCNINFNRRFLDIARKNGKIIATDVHTIKEIDDSYNSDFMKSATILFQSDENLPCSPEEWAKIVIDRYGTEIVVVGLGKNGVLLSVKKDNCTKRYKAVYTRPVVNTIGAGDALFGSFVHFYNKTSDPYYSIEKAKIFASYKIGENGAANGFLTEEKLDEISYSEID